MLTMGSRALVNASAKKGMLTLLPVAAALALCALLAGCGGTLQQAGSAADSESDATQAMTGDTSFVWSVDADCGLCHATQASSLTDPSCQVSANHANVQCVRCHTDESDLATVHEGATLASVKSIKNLSKTSVGQDACIECHADAGAPEAAASSTVLTDDQGTTVNPHDLPQSGSHDTLTCGSCHTMHDTKPLEETAPAACTQCHHQNVYECYTCHE